MDNALVVAQNLLQFLPILVENVLRMECWVMRIADLVGYAYNHPALTCSHALARMHASDHDPAAAGHSHACSSWVRSPRH